MALGDLVVLKPARQERIMAETVAATSSPNHSSEQAADRRALTPGEDAESVLGLRRESGGGTSMVYFPQGIYLSDLRHDACIVPRGPAEIGFVSKWQTKDRMKTGSVALVLCLNIGMDPPDVIKISPCARMECWIDPFSMSAPKALDAIGKTLQAQYEQWQPRARYKLQLDPTVDEVKKLCSHCRKNAKSERVLFHYNGHGVPKPTANGEIWLFNKSYTQYIPLSVYDLGSWLGTPSIYVFDCSAAGMIVNAFTERQERDTGGTSMDASKDCIILAACGPEENLPQNIEFPADVFTSCLTTPIKMALQWFCPRSLLRDSFDPNLIDKIPGRQNDRKTPLGELNWIFTAVTDTIAWNVLPRELFQRLFRKDLLVASLFRNFLLAERIMHAANCSPISFPQLPSAHQHPMWDAWDMAAEICISQLPTLVNDPNAVFQPSPFFTEQLTAFEVWLEHGSEWKKPPEQLPIVLQVLLSQSHRCRALVLLGRFLDMGAWAVDLALSVGIFPYVLKLLQTTATELRQILVFIWTKILALDKSCQVDLVKDSGHQYFVKFLDSPDIYAEQRAMAAFVLAVIVDGHRRGQEACVEAGLINICLKHMQPAPATEVHPEPLLLQWLCLCLGKLWEGFPEAQLLGLHENAPAVFLPLLFEAQPEVRASAVYALGTLVDVGTEAVRDRLSLDDDDVDEEKLMAELEIAKHLLRALTDGSPLVRAELAIALLHFAVGHGKHLKSMAAAYLKPPSNSMITSLPSFGAFKSPKFLLSGGAVSVNHASVLRVENDGPTMSVEGRVATSSPPEHSSEVIQGSPPSDCSSHLSKGSKLLPNDACSNGNLQPPKSKGMYAQCVAAAYALARDPSPRVSSLGREILQTIGVEPVVMRSVRSHAGAGHHRNASVPSVTPTLPGIARSFSWLDLNSGNLPITFRTPPASPPTQQNYLTGMRRVCSLEFSSHLCSAADTGLADSSLPSGSLALAPEGGLLQQSTIYNWSCGHFSRPILAPAQDNDKDEILARREERERMALDGIAKCQHSSICKVSDRVSIWDTCCETVTKAALLHPFIPIVIAADEEKTVRIWNYEENVVVNAFDNHVGLDRGISKLCLVNELNNSLLLVASSDGSVRVWKDYTEKGKQRLAAALQATQGHRPGARSVNAVVDWQQLRGYLYAAGEISSIMVWDLDRELPACSIPSASESCISALSASQVHGGQLAAGCGDGSVRLFDIRTREMLVYETRPDVQSVERVVGIDFLPGLDPAKIVSASQGGEIQFLDVRNSTSPYLTIDAHRGFLTALAVHRHAPIIASGSAKQYIKVFNIHGELLSMVRYHNSFLGQRIGPVSCLSFHPYSVLLGTGATDGIVSIYAGENTQTR